MAADDDHGEELGQMDHDELPEEVIKAKLCTLSVPISKRAGAGVIVCNQPRPCKYHEAKA